MRFTLHAGAARLLAAMAIIMLAPWAARAQAAPGAGYRIAGRVVNAVTGEPVPRATVNVYSEEQDRLVATALADAEGNFAVPGLPAGKYPISASRRGFRTSYYDEHEGFSTAMVTGPGQDTEHLVFPLAPGAVIFGTISGDGGDPVQNASLLLFRRDSEVASRHPVVASATQSDDTGAYEFTDLAPGDYFVAVQAQPWYAIHGFSNQEQGGENPLDVAYPVTYFDSTTDEASATPLAIAAGTRTEANISLHAVPALRIRIPQTRQREGRPPVEIRQSIFGSDLPVQADIDSVGQGPWELKGLAPGQYHLSTNDPPRNMDLNASSSMDLDPNAGTPSQPVDGTLRMADGSAPGDVVLVLSSPEGRGMQTTENAVAHMGKFHFDGVPSGEWVVTAFRGGATSQNLFVSSITAGGGSASGNLLTVRSSPLSMVVTLSTSQTRVEGFARKDGKPAAGAMIVLVPRDPAVYPALARRDQSDSDGSFSLREVAPGRYTVVAILDGWKLDWQDRAVIARFLPGGEPVTFGAESGGVIRLSRPVEAASR